MASLKLWRCVAKCILYYVSVGDAKHSRVRSIHSDINKDIHVFLDISQRSALYFRQDKHSVQSAMALLLTQEMAKTPSSQNPLVGLWELESAQFSGFGYKSKNLPPEDHL